jgi:hypothetical protein
MNEKIISEIIGQVFNFAMEAAIAFWNELLNWVYNSMVNWIQDLDPALAKSAQVAFVSLAQVAIATLPMIKEAWKTIRQSLLEAIVEFSQSSSSSMIWLRHLTSILLKKSDSGQTVILKREVEESVNWDDLPSNVREAWLGSTQKSYKVDFIDARDKEIEVMTMTN